MEDQSMLLTEDLTTAVRLDERVPSPRLRHLLMSAVVLVVRATKTITGALPGRPSA